ncbi:MULTISPECIES: hypothetical protein [Sphingobacterium]|uniref:hypothetical protein n=1 Tax=Sphingobacterium TaxID=28453 RepID=UPI000E81A187|nr:MULTISPECIES: hypothetical protein [Sphingobacterium]HAK28342.1 hypothetical protein [Sphingobacterium sp.]HBI87835.1 hypothetical protein [Sphingobacterium sp.]
MGLSFKKDVLMNWIEEIGKFLRIWTEGHDAFTEPTDPAVFEDAYEKFFEKSRTYFLNLSENELSAYLKTDLQIHQLHPLALTLLFDGLNATDGNQENLLRKAKFILNLAMAETASFAFQDYQYLAMIDNKLKSL